MLSFPTQYDHYEPLNKQSSNFTGKLHQRRKVVAIALVLVSLLGGYELFRLQSISGGGGLAKSSSASTSAPGTSTTLTWGGNNTLPLINGETDAIPVVITSPPPASPAPPIVGGDGVVSSSSECLLPTISTTTISSTHNIDEADWHMPADVILAINDPLYRSRMRPYFRQELEDIHREKGFGTAVDLHDAPFIRRSLYRHLLQSFHGFAAAHDFHFWLAHGSLLGQRWGQKIMSGDTDVDLQCTLGALHRVVQFQNQLWDDRFELVVNPHYLIRKTRNFRGLGSDKNVIDARWIDVLTGHYIDITALASSAADDPVNDFGPFEGEKVTTIVQDKSPHRYNVGDITPNRPCRFEGMDFWCPNERERVLQEEYRWYQLPHFQTWRFNETIQAFNEVTCLQLFNMYRFPTPENCDEECRYVVSKERHLKWNYLVMQGDGGIKRKGCMLKITWLEDGDEKKHWREYWGLDVPGKSVKLRNEQNVTYPGVKL